MGCSSCWFEKGGGRNGCDGKVHERYGEWLVGPYHLEKGGGEDQSV